MSLRNNQYELRFKKGSFLAFEQRVIASGLCDLVLPMSFSSIKDMEIARYDCSGFVAVKDLEGITFNFAFEIITKLLYTYDKTSEFFINPRKMRIDLDTVYFHLSSRLVRLAYVPEEEEPVFIRVRRFAKALSTKTNEETAAYIDTIFSGIEKYNFRLDEMADYIIEQQRKICGIIEQ